MDKHKTFNVDSDVYDKFVIALELTGETEDMVIEKSMRSYIAETFGEVSQAYNPKTAGKRNLETDKDYYGKAIRRIPAWAAKPGQYNHKIIRAYFKAIEISGRATVELMERLCSDKESPDLYVPTFKNNYSQMKLDGAKSHGKVFEDDGETVTIWPEVKETLMKYKSSFCE